MSNLAAEEMIVSRSPQDPSEEILRVPATPPGKVREVVERGREAMRGWSTMPPVQRANGLEAVADSVRRAGQELTDLMVREVGKPRAEAAAEVQRGVAILRYFAQQVLDPVGQVLPSPGRSILYTYRRPRGVAGLITPWNFPVAIPLWKAAPALAFGNTVVLKPSPEATAVALRLESLIEDSLGRHVLSVVPGGGPTGAALVESADLVSFTGSVPIGRAVSASAAERGIPYQAEMGGLNASIVLPDADVQLAAKIIAGAAMGYAGQKCTATSRVIVVGRPEPFIDALVAAVEAMKVGEPNQDETLVGPVINQSARDKVTDAASEARSLGARLLVGGASLDRPGWYVSPTLVDGLPVDARLLREEVFGPICAIIQAQDSQEAVAISNAVTYGLVTSVFTGDLSRALEVVQDLDTGLVRVNAPTSGVDFHAPFGGEKASSVGHREQGKAAQDFYTSLHTVTLSAEG